MLAGLKKISLFPNPVITVPSASGDLVKVTAVVLTPVEVYLRNSVVIPLGEFDGCDNVIVELPIAVITVPGFTNPEEENTKVPMPTLVVPTPTFTIVVFNPTKVLFMNTSAGESVIPERVTVSVTVLMPVIVNANPVFVLGILLANTLSPSSRAAVIEIPSPLITLVLIPEKVPSTSNANMFLVADRPAPTKMLELSA